MYYPQRFPCEALIYVSTRFLDRQNAILLWATIYGTQNIRTVWFIKHVLKEVFLFWVGAEATRRWEQQQAFVYSEHNVRQAWKQTVFDSNNTVIGILNQTKFHVTPSEQNRDKFIYFIKSFRPGIQMMVHFPGLSGLHVYLF